MINAPKPGADVLSQISKLWDNIIAAVPIPNEQQKEAIRNEFNNGLDDIKKTLNDSLEKMHKDLAELDKNIATANAADVAYGEVPTLDSQMLFEMARSIIVQGANGIAVYHEVKKNFFSTAEFLYLANVKDRELLPAEANKYAILKAKNITDDVKALFAESELVILN